MDSVQVARRLYSLLRGRRRRPKGAHQDEQAVGRLADRLQAAQNAAQADRSRRRHRGAVHRLRARVRPDPPDALRERRLIKRALMLALTL